MKQKDASFMPKSAICLNEVKVKTLDDKIKHIGAGVQGIGQALIKYQEVLRNFHPKPAQPKA